ncbi:MAG: PhoU domain-containing protein [Myxococcota bacterium]|nr:PhoU domain-containing protein [Myxococcota bacterium]
MWRELIQILRDNDPIEPMAREFIEMLTLAEEMSDFIQPTVLDHSLSLDHRKKVYKLDVKINKLERSIRKRIITHLNLKGGHVSYCLVLMSIVKDAERIGDYMKNISEVGELGGEPIPQGELLDELSDIMNLAIETLKATPTIIQEEQQDRANEYIQGGRNAGKRCDHLLKQLAKSNLSPAQTTSMVLLTRFYKRLSGHLLNILSSVVMPLHKVDFYDSRELGHT